MFHLWGWSLRNIFNYLDHAKIFLLHWRHGNFSPSDEIKILPREINRQWLCFLQWQISKTKFRIQIHVFT